jgi:hypothetical protein
MEVDSGEPFIVEEIGTKTNLITKIKTEIDLITKIEANATEVEEAISFTIQTPRCDSTAHDYIPPTSQ